MAIICFWAILQVSVARLITRKQRVREIREDVERHFASPEFYEVARFYLRLLGGPDHPLLKNLSSKQTTLLEDYTKEENYNEFKNFKNQF